MKIRNGFVSNSSSSSFIIGKKYLPDELTVESIKKQVFGDAEYEAYEYDSSVLFETSMLSKEILDAFNDQKTGKEALGELLRENVMGYDEYSNIIDKYTKGKYPNKDTSEEERQLYIERMNKAHEEIEKIQNERINAAIKEDFSDDEYVIIEFEDSYNVGSHLEHSGIIENSFNAKRISQH